MTDLRFAGRKHEILNVTIPFFSYPNFTDLELLREDNNSLVFLRNASILTNVLKVKNIFYGQMVSLDGYALNIIIGNMAEEDFTSYHLYIHNSIGVTSAALQFVAQSKNTYIMFRINRDNALTIKWKLYCDMKQIRNQLQTLMIIDMQTQYRSKLKLTCI